MPAPWHAPPPLNGLLRQGVIFSQWAPDKHHHHIVKNSTHLDLVLVPAVKGFMGTLDQECVPTWHQVLWPGRGVEATAGLANTDMMDAIFDVMGPGGTPSCEFHCAFLSWSSPHIAHLPIWKRQVNSLAWSLPAPSPQDRPHQRRCQCPLCPRWCHPTKPPRNGMAAHQRFPRLQAPEASKVGDVVYGMPV